jgi:hypothetical protein
MAARGFRSLGRQAALLAFLAFLVCPFLRAQKLPAVEAWGGYSHLRFDATTLGFSDQLNLNGWSAGLSLPHIVSGLGVAADASGHYTPELEEYNFMVGPQYSFEWKSMRFYAHGMFGRSRNRLRHPGSTLLAPSWLGRAIAAGGGVDIPVSERFSVRVVQADYLVISSFGTRQYNLRLSTGLIYRFGKR